MLLTALLFSLAAVSSGAIKVISTENGGRFRLLSIEREYLDWLMGTPEHLKYVESYAPRTPYALRCAAYFFGFIEKVLTVCAVVAYCTATNVLLDILLLYVCRIIAQHFAIEYLFTLYRSDANAFAYFKRIFTPKFRK